MSFFSASKLGWVVLMPSNLLVFLVLAAAALSRFKTTKVLAHRIGAMAAIGLLSISLLPIGDLLLTSLEQRFPPLQRCVGAGRMPIAGIILLGGSVGSITTQGRVEEIMSGGDRIRFAASLARAYPGAPLVISGGRTFPRPGARSEAVATAALLRELGVSPDRIVLETGSRTTAENAAFVARRTRDRSRWLLVTSAYHMPRAMGAFRAAGLNVIAAPTDWQVDEHAPLLAFSVTDRLRNFDTAAKEYAGLLAYWATGRSEALFPGPNTSGRCIDHARQDERDTLLSP